MIRIPFGEKFDCEKAPPIALAKRNSVYSAQHAYRPRAVRLELHA